MTANLTGRTIVAAQSEEIAPDAALLVIVLDDGTVLGGLRVVDAGNCGQNDRPPP